MNILILGKGFLGTKIYQFLQTNHLDGVRHLQHRSRAELDYTNYDTLRRYIEPDTLVINASGYTGVPNIDAAEENKSICWKMNVEVPATIMSAASHLIHISSGCIFNGYEKEWAEDDIPNFGLFNSNSSFYSKTKHAAETLLVDRQCAILRIRMPFCADLTPRNYFAKLLKYDNLISTPNSVTCIEDLCVSVLDLCRQWSNCRPINGIYHMVNKETLTAKQVVKCLNKYGLTNPNHRFISLEEFYGLGNLAPQVKAARSNCVLAVTEITLESLAPLPSALDSLEKCVKQYAAQYLKTKIDYSI